MTTTSASTSPASLVTVSVRMGRCMPGSLGSVTMILAVRRYAAPAGFVVGTRLDPTTWACVVWEVMRTAHWSMQVP